MSSNDINEIVFDVYSNLIEAMGGTRRPARRSFLGQIRWAWRMVRQNPRYLRCRYGREILMGKNDNWCGLNDFVPTARTFPETRIAVYTVITGGYDNFRLPLYVDETLDYYVVTDSPAEISNSCKGGGGGCNPCSRKAEGL